MNYFRHIVLRLLCYIYTISMFPVSIECFLSKPRNIGPKQPVHNPPEQNPAPVAPADTRAQIRNLPHQPGRPSPDTLRQEAIVLAGAVLPVLMRDLHQRVGVANVRQHAHVAEREMVDFPKVALVKPLGQPFGLLRRRLRRHRRRPHLHHRVVADREHVLQHGRLALLALELHPEMPVHEQRARSRRLLDVPCTAALGDGGRRRVAILQHRGRRRELLHDIQRLDELVHRVPRRPHAQAHAHFALLLRLQGQTALGVHLMRPIRVGSAPAELLHVVRRFDLDAMPLHPLHGVSRQRLVEHAQYLGRNVVQRDARLAPQRRVELVHVADDKVAQRGRQLGARGARTDDGEMQQVALHLLARRGQDGQLEALADPALDALRIAHVAEEHGVLAHTGRVERLTHAPDGDDELVVGDLKPLGLLPQAEMLLAAAGARLGPVVELLLGLVDAGLLGDAAPDDGRLADDDLAVEIDGASGGLDKVDVRRAVAHGLDDAGEVEVPGRGVDQERREDEVRPGGDDRAGVLLVRQPAREDVPGPAGPEHDDLFAGIRRTSRDDFSVSAGRRGQETQASSSGDLLPAR